MYCAPSRENEKISCYSLDSLKKIAHAYNEKYGGNIKTNGKTKIALWDDIRKGLSQQCKHEICWIDQDFIKKIKDKEIHEETFRPKMPDEWKRDMTTWLSSDDIDLVMKQYEKAYPGFFFVGPVPIDCGVDGPLRCQLTNFNLKKMINGGIDKIGIVYNTDDSYGRRDMKHWEAVFINLKSKEILFYDSYGTKPPREIMNLMKNIQKQAKDIGIEMIIDYNKTRHQYDDFNCGVYSMYFIILMLKGKTLKDVERMKIPTTKMQQMKKYLYRTV